jgi:hypothetical protein
MLEALRAEGVCAEEVWAYGPEPTPPNLGQGPPPPAVTGARRYQIGAFRALAGSGATLREAICASIAERKIPVLTATPVEAMAGWLRGPHIELRVGVPTEEALHMIAIVGYDLDGEFLEFRNSWGVGWGLAGYGTLSFSYAERMLASTWELSR